MKRIDWSYLATSISGTLFFIILVIRAFGLPSSTYQAMIFTVVGAFFGGTTFSLLPFERLEGKPWKRLVCAICVFIVIYVVMKKWAPLR